MDLTVKRIVNAYHAKAKKWKREALHPRKFEGIIVIERGSIEYYFEDSRFVASAGDLLLLPSGSPYNGRMLTQDVSYYVIDLECDRAEDFQAIAPSVIKLASLEDACAKMEAATVVWQKQGIDAPLRIKAMAYELLCLAISAEGSGKSATPTGEIVEYIIANLGDPTLSVKQLCERFYISESQLRRNMIKQTGARPNEYIMKLRINKAKPLLLYTQKSIQQISESCGFSSPYYFSRCFKSEVGESPREYRSARTYI